MRKRPGRAVLFFWGALVLASGSPMLFGQRMFEGIKGRIYTGLSFSYINVLGKSFDGNRYFGSPAEFIPVPELGAASGLGGVLGFRGESIGIEVSYYYYRHSGTLIDPTPQYEGPRPEKIGHHVGNIDFKGHFWPASRLEGYYQVGVAVIFLSVNKSIFGVEDNVWTAEGDVTYQGAAINLGLGLDYWLTPQIGLTVGVYCRPMFFTTLKQNLPGEYADIGTYDYDVSGMKGLGLGLTAGILINLK